MSLYENLSKITYSKDCYLSGFRALNILDTENNTGDWHKIQCWHDDYVIAPTHILGKLSPVSNFDTTYYFGEDGLFQANQILKEMGIPKFSDYIVAATHARAIADLVLCLALQTKKPTKVMDFKTFDDFMDSPSDKERVYVLLDKALLKLDGTAKELVSEWLEKAKGIDYDSL